MSTLATLNAEFFWRIFQMTGSITAYLLYRKMYTAVS
ncbi:MAG: YqzL family protein [Bacillota bacterium]